MPKWISPLFSDIRNKLADTVVFSNWKGRTYFRGYVIPANPQTAKQQANRDVMNKLVERWKAVIDTEDKASVWNAEALTQQITGYNLFVKYGMKSNISCPSTGSTGSPVTITYTSGAPVANAKIYAYDGSAWEDITPSGGLEAGTNKTFDHTFSNAGTYEIYIANGNVLVEGDTPPQPYQAVSKWSRDNVNGVAKEAKIVIS